MMKHFKYLILLFLFPAVLSAQSLRQQIAKKEVNTEKKQQKNPNSVIKANKPRHPIILIAASRTDLRAEKRVRNYAQRLRIREGQNVRP